MSDSRRHALVIGAGLAGAAACSTLARRGWRITLLDAADGPAGGASSLPVGMLSPHVTRSPTPLSRLSALGVADTLAELRRLVPEGAGWQTCEVDNLAHDPGRWPAALVRPSALVQAWLNEATGLGALTCIWKAHVDRLEPKKGVDPSGPGVWQACDARGRPLAQAPVVVLAAALGSFNLLTGASGQLSGTDLPLRPVQGQMSLAALEGPALAERPQRNDGVFVPRYQDSGLPPLWPATVWTMGSTYERGMTHTHVSLEAHERNARSLHAIHPAAADRLRTDLAEGRLMGWAQVRCASLDRLPLVGAAPDTAALSELMAAGRGQRDRVQLADVPRWQGLHLLCAMGSRGLTLAHWCAEQLAIQLEGVPALVESDLMGALDPARFALRNVRRRGSAQERTTAG
ncbi:FAD-dependent oxidoreductase [Hydrogenophaga sp. PBL-H3]|uniref:FAD-dependent oxidoreductase n=1 Tax=Hydrogenophaga sp. PBL-H3 TaxID=434010 RepID=UPI00132001A2|nr:FAD-dependent oxidoreductase [Hydrogenophaga sp. PBL-H3]QHE76599.1 FAD-dependent oxidoreductase [Hydrogenophaga sp. PBL-H3]QHE81023.1 FAD-dependent oxidoreductase [Hydrogenophaga sp. PBL-H3]